MLKHNQGVDLKFVQIRTKMRCNPMVFSERISRFFNFLYVSSLGFLLGYSIDREYFWSRESKLALILCLVSAFIIIIRSKKGGGGTRRRR